ncbi:MAG: hypothetical protein BGO59_24065 [Spirosoma sp. 48-14]|nr:MAG: hypothetical protein BGO59_24065 [Spirosoma sp. 48-14]
MPQIMKILLIVSMVLVWGWTIFMGLFATHANGRRAGWLIGCTINILLAIYYSYLVKRPKTVKEWLKM